MIQNRAYWIQVLQPVLEEHQLFSRPSRYAGWIADDLMWRYGANLSEAIVAKTIADLLEGMPLAYANGVGHFYGRKFHVSDQVLIPRPETEELVDLILQCHGNSPLSVLDIGTGSACIPITLSKERSNWNITAVDVSESALEVAKKNQSLFETRIEFIAADFLDEHTWAQLPSPDVLVSNPPYIPPSEAHMMDESVLNFEPRMALFVPEEDPQLFYRALATFAQQRMQAGGFLYAECNAIQARNTFRLWEAMGLKEVALLEDMSGNNRMIKAQVPNT